MAVTRPEPSALGPRHGILAGFAALKLRVLRNSLRGRGRRIALFVVGLGIGAWSAVVGFIGLATSGAADDPDVALVTAAFAGTALVLGWLFFPLVWFGVDETLDPARFALLPLPRRALIGGLLVAALLGVPAIATLLGSAGLVVAAAIRGGWAAAVAQTIGVLAGLLLCVSVSRAVTSAFAAMLRSRHTRDLAVVALAGMGALLGPLQIGVLAAVQGAGLDRLAGMARILGWTPLAAAYTVGTDVATGRPVVAAAKLALTVASIGLLLWWWSASLESAMVGRSTQSARRPVRGGSASPVDQLYGPLLRHAPRGPFGAIVAREVRYWWRDARRRANLITIAVVGVFIPLVFGVGAFGTTGDAAGYGAEGFSVTFDGAAASPVSLGLSMTFVGALAALMLANQFGFDGSAYAAHLVAGVPGRTELAARMVAASLYMAPLITLITVTLGLVSRRPGLIPGTLASGLGAYGAALAVNQFVSILGAYALPETSNPFAVNTGAGLARSLLALLALAGTMALSAPLTAAAVLLGAAWPWLALPIGLGYGFGAAILGCHLAGDVLDRRGPELLAEVTPER